MPKSVREWTEHWDRKFGIADPIELNGYCVGGKPLSAEQYAEIIVEPAIARLEVEAHHHVLEIGCGSGQILKVLEKRVARCVGVDPSKSMLARYEGRSETHVCAADELPFADNTFDQILMVGVALYFPSIEHFVSVVETCLALLRTPGVLLIGDLPTGPSRNDYLTFQKTVLVEIFDRIGHPYSIMAQTRAKRKINRRIDVVVYKDHP